MVENGRGVRVLLPLEATSVIGAVGGLAEITREALGGGGNSKAPPTPPARPPRRAGGAIPNV